jgi:hypothetical protein
MRFILSLLLLISTATFSQQPYFYALQGRTDSTPPEPPVGTQFRGVWGIGNLSNNEIDNYAALGTEGAWKGYFFTEQWADVELADGVYDFTTIDADLAEIESYGIYAGFMIFVGPASPSWLMTLAGTYTTGGGANTYPKYYAPEYTTRYYRLLDTIAHHIAQYSNVIVQQLAIGKTGDQGAHVGTPDAPYIGDPEVPQGDGEDSTWVSFTIKSWDSLHSYLEDASAGQIRLLANTGNDHENNDTVYAKFAQTAWIKEGRLSHNYAFDGMAVYPGLPNQLSRGEVQGFPLVSLHPQKDAFQIVVTAVGLGLGIFNTPSGWYVQGDGADPRHNSFFNRYANDTIASTSDVAFIQLALPISIDSIERWDSLTFGPVIADVDTVAYNNDTAAINANTEWSDDYKAVRKIGKTIQYINTARVTALSTGTGTDAEYDYGTDNDYDNDFVYSGVNNFSRFITQVVDGHGEYRVGPDTSIYGRWAKSFDSAGGYPDMTFQIESGWAGIVTGNVSITITYFDNGTGQWSFKNGSTTLQTVTNTNTGQWKQVVITDAGFTVADGFSLHYISGLNTIFTLVELKKNLE